MGRGAGTLRNGTNGGLTLKFKWKSESNIDKCKAFICKDYLFVRREHDGKWTCFSKYCGWQQGPHDMVGVFFKDADKVFYPGDVLEWEF